VKYQVIVSNIGKIVDTDDMREASRTFHEYVWRSVEGEGRSAGETVSFFRDGELVGEFVPDRGGTG